MVPEGRSAAPEVKEQSAAQPSPRPPRLFKSKEQLMLRANSLKKALRQIIDQAEKGEMRPCLCGQQGNGRRHKAGLAQGLALVGQPPERARGRGGWAGRTSRMASPTEAWWRLSAGCQGPWGWLGRRGRCCWGCSSRAFRPYITDRFATFEQRVLLKIPFDVLIVGTRALQGLQVPL